MNKTHLEAIHFVESFRNQLLPTDYESTEIVICPAFTALRSVQTAIEADRIPVALGAQDVHWEDSGAYTGEISGGMLAKLNVNYVIVGHSERRTHFGDTDEIVSRKAVAVLNHGLVPIVCVGETLQQREAGLAEDTVVVQIGAALSGLDDSQMARVVVAYEPIWAIGTGRTASPEDAQQMHSTIRRTVESVVSAAAAAQLRIQYGGSVNPGNIAALMSCEDIDGALVGGASLDPKDFSLIVRFDK